jgi:hypothetical protein
MWEVRITQVGPKFDFRSDFFPRRVYYAADALELVREVEKKGGKAIIVRVKQ